MSIDYFSVRCPNCLAAPKEPCKSAWVCSSRKAVLEHRNSGFEDALLEGTVHSISFTLLLNSKLNPGPGVQVSVFVRRIFVGALGFDDIESWKTVAYSFWMNSNPCDGHDSEDWDGWFSRLMENKQGYLYLNRPEENVK